MFPMVMRWINHIVTLDNKVATVKNEITHLAMSTQNVDNQQPLVIRTSGTSQLDFNSSGFSQSIFCMRNCA